MFGEVGETFVCHCLSISTCCIYLIGRHNFFLQTQLDCELGGGDEMGWYEMGWGEVGWGETG